MQKSCKKIAKILQKVVVKNLQNLCRFFAEFLQLHILQKVLHFRPREESVKFACTNFRALKLAFYVACILYSNVNFSIRIRFIKRRGSRSRRHFHLGDAVIYLQLQIRDAKLYLYYSNKRRFHTSDTFE